LPPSDACKAIGGSNYARQDSMQVFIGKGGGQQLLRRSLDPPHISAGMGCAVGSALV